MLRNYGPMDLLYRGTIPNGKNLPLTQFQHLRQLLVRSCSYLLPRQDGRISQNYVSGRFLPFGMVPLYTHVSKNK